MDLEGFNEALLQLSEEDRQEVMALSKGLEYAVQRNPLSVYKPHTKQRAFHDALDPRHNEKWFIAGNRSGKTVSGATEVSMHATGQYPDWFNGRRLKQPTAGWCVSLDSNVQREVAQAEVLKWLPKGLIKKIQYVQKEIINYIELKNGSLIGFKNVETGREKFQGTSKDYIWFDEEPPRDVYDECKARVIDTDGIIMGTMTPLKGFTWVYTDILQDSYKEGSKKIVINASMRDNPYLSTSVVMDYEGSLDEKQKRMRVGGEFVMHEGLIYDEFRLDMHLCDRFDIPSDWPIIAGIDFGSNHPTAMSVMTGVDDTWFVIEEYKMGGADIETHAGNMLAILAGYFGQVKKVVGDPSAKILITEYGKYGLYIQKAKNDVHSGINRVKVLLKPRPVMGQGMEPKLFVFNDLIKTVEEFGLYRWADRRRGGLDNIDGLDHPEKENDHILDALRYAVMSLDNSTFQSITSGVMPIIKNKRRHNLQYLTGYQ